MNKKQKMAIILLSIFIIGMCIGAADAAHTVKKGKTKVKITNKEYKKLTATKTKYKNVTKTRKVTKYKNVTKTRQVEKTKTEEKNNVIVNHTYYEKCKFWNEEYGAYETRNLELYQINDSEEVKNLKSEGYTGSQTWREYYSYPNLEYDEEGGYGYNEEHNVTQYSHYYIKATFQNFTKTSNYTIDEEYTVKEPYTVSEKYQVRVPYKVRKSATVTKKVPKKYKTVKEAYYVWKKVKSYYTVSEWKYVGKSEILGLQTPAMKKDTQKRVKKIRANGWKINKNEHRSKYDLVDGGIYRHYYLCTKKVYYTEKKKVKKYKKVKKQVKMRIKSWAQNACPKGKVWVTLYYGDQLKKGKCISEGYAKIK